MSDRESFDEQAANEERHDLLSRRGFLTGSSAALATTGIATIGDKDSLYPGLPGR